MGQEATGALGGAAGVQAFSNGRYDVVFSDLGMPELNGWDLAVSVKRHDPSVRVVLVTGWAHQLEGGSAQAHGVDIVMPKPFSIEDVEAVLRTLADRAEHHRAA
jgi:DNA-binding response OmpR family regulator